MNYSTNEVCNITGITFRELNYWNRKRIVGPPPNGSGNPLRWTYQDILSVMVTRDLRALGVPLNRIDLAIKVAPAAPLAPLVLVISATKCEWVLTPPTNLSAYVLVRMDLLIDELNEEISKITSFSRTNRVY